MPIKIDGQLYDTVADAARQFGVSAKTVHSWIGEKVLPEPKIIRWGRRRIRIFTKEYMQKAKEILDR